MERRAFVVGSGAAIVASIVGCNGILADEDGDEPRVFAFSLVNDSWEESMAFGVRILSVDDVLVEETFELGPNERETAIHLDGSPSSIHVSLDGSKHYVFGWPASPSRANRLARRADIHYDPRFDQDIRVVPSDFEP